MSMVLGKNKTRGVPVIIIVIAAILTAGYVCSALYQQSQFRGSINWNSIDDVDRADKLVFFNVSSKWCGPCNTMDEYTFRHNKVAKAINKNFFPVKVDGGDSSGMQFCKKYKIYSFPTILITDHKTYKELHRVVGYQHPKEFLREIAPFIK